MSGKKAGKASGICALIWKFARVEKLAPQTS
jgi:hypothetical protein